MRLGQLLQQIEPVEIPVDADDLAALDTPDGGEWHAEGLSEGRDNARGPRERAGVGSLEDAFDGNPFLTGKLASDFNAAVVRHRSPQREQVGGARFPVEGAAEAQANDPPVVR